MRIADYRKLESVQSVVEFCRSHPDPSLAAIAAVANLESLLNHARALMGAQRLSEEEARSARSQREAIAGPLRQRLSHLIRLAAAVAEQERRPPFLPTVPLGATRGGQLLEAGRAALAVATEHRALLLHYGMPERLLDDLARDLERFASFQRRRPSADTPGTSAGAELRALIQEALIVVKHLDALNRLRLAEDPPRLAEWLAARRIRWHQEPASSSAPEQLS